MSPKFWVWGFLCFGGDVCMCVGVLVYYGGSCQRNCAFVIEFFTDFSDVLGKVV